MLLFEIANLILNYYDLFFFEEGFREKLDNIPAFKLFTMHAARLDAVRDFGFQVSALQVQDGLGPTSFDEGHEIFEFCDGTRYNVVIGVGQLFGARPDRGDIVQPQCLSNSFHYLDFLANRVAKGKLDFWKQNGQRDAGKPTTGTDVEHTVTVCKGCFDGQRQGVQDMVQVERVHVFAGDDIDPAVPFLVQRTQLANLILLFWGQVREVLEN